MTAQRDRAAELKAVIDEMRYLEQRPAPQVAQATLKQWADRLSALAEAAPGPSPVAWYVKHRSGAETITLNPEKARVFAEHGDTTRPLIFGDSPPLAPESPSDGEIYAEVSRLDHPELNDQVEKIVADIVESAHAPERAEDRGDALIGGVPFSVIAKCEQDEGCCVMIHDQTRIPCTPASCVYMERYAAAIAAMQTGGKDK